MPAKYPLLEEIDRDSKIQRTNEDDEDFGPTVPTSAIKSWTKQMFSNQKANEDKGKYIKINLAP